MYLTLLQLDLLPSWPTSAGFDQLLDLGLGKRLDRRAGEALQKLLRQPAEGDKHTHKTPAASDSVLSVKEQKCHLLLSVLTDTRHGAKQHHSLRHDRNHKQTLNPPVELGSHSSTLS